VATKKMLHGLGNGELHIHHPAMAQHHDKKTQSAPGITDRHRLECPPVHLGAFSRSEGQLQKSLLLPGSDLANIVFYDGVAAGKALLADLLKTCWAL
jgi:hypothetical protein